MERKKVFDIVVYIQWDRIGKLSPMQRRFRKNIIRRIALSILSRNSLRVTTYNTIARINFIGEITLERKRRRGKNWN